MGTERSQRVSHSIGRQAPASAGCSVISTLLTRKWSFADEPTSALDVSTQKSVIKWFLNLLEKRHFLPA